MWAIISLSILLTVSGFVNFILITRLLTIDDEPGEREKLFCQSDQLQALLEAFQDEASSKEEEAEQEEELPEGYTRMNIAVVNNEAYWIEDHRLVKAPYWDEEIDMDRAAAVKTDRLNSDELETLMRILDVLKEGENEDSNSGE